MNCVHRLATLMLVAAAATSAVRAQDLTMDFSELVVAFDSANACYERGEFDQALFRYEALLASYRHFESEFNAGNAAYKLGEYGRARVHYERAALLDPSHPHLEANQAILKSKIVDRITAIPTLGLAAWFSSWVGPAHVNRWAIWALFWWTAGWALLVLRGYKNRRDSRATAAFLGAASLALGLVGIWGTRACSVQAESPLKLVIMAPRVDVLSTPSTGGTVLFQLHEGSSACILDRTNGWSEIQLDNGNVGWVSDASTEDI